MVKKILQINGFNVGSTGTIMRNIHQIIELNNYKGQMAYPVSKTNLANYREKDVLIGNVIERNLSIILGYLTGFNDFYGIIGTIFFLKKIKKSNPDIIHLHNIHGNFVNFPLLIFFLKKINKPIIWTMHDCWSFTGGCTHFTNQESIDDEIFYYSTRNNYPKTLFNNQRSTFLLKRKILLNLENINFVAPSQWLRDIAKKTYLNKYPIQTINNGIDLNVFKARTSNLRDELGLHRKTIVLGVSSVWNKEKGREIFIELSKMLSDNFQIILIGVTEEEKSKIPANIICVARTESKKELSKYYSMADVFLNTSFYETMGMVTLESLACGTPVIVSNRTAIPEFVNPKTGFIVKENTALEFYQLIVSKKWKEIDPMDCIRWAESFAIEKKYNEYIDLYNSLLSK